MLELTFKNGNLPIGGESFFITALGLAYSELCGGAPSSSIIGKRITPQEAFEIFICQTADAPPIASGEITLSTAAHDGYIIAIIKWQSSGLEVLKESRTWDVTASGVPPGSLGPVTITVKGYGP